MEADFNKPPSLRQKGLGPDSPSPSPVEGEGSLRQFPRQIPYFPELPADISSA